MSVKSVNTSTKVGETISDATSTIKGIAEDVREKLKFQPPQVLYGPAPSTEEIEELDLNEFDENKIISEELLPHEQMKYGPPPSSIEHSPYEDMIDHEQMKYGPPPAPYIPSQIIENISQQEQYKYGPAPNGMTNDFIDSNERVKEEERARKHLDGLYNVGETPATFDFPEPDDYKDKK